MPDDQYFNCTHYSACPPPEPCLDKTAHTKITGHFSRPLFRREGSTPNWWIHSGDSWQVLNKCCQCIFLSFILRDAFSLGFSYTSTKEAEYVRVWRSWAWLHNEGSTGPVTTTAGLSDSYWIILQWMWTWVTAPCHAGDDGALQLVEILLVLHEIIFGSLLFSTDARSVRKFQRSQLLSPSFGSWSTL